MFLGNSIFRVIKLKSAKVRKNKCKIACNAAETIFDDFVSLFIYILLLLLI